MTTHNSKNEDPITHETGAHPVGTGVGATGGALTGAALGSMVGPIGTLAGGIIGAIAGGLAGKELAEANNPTIGGDHSEHIVGEGVGAGAGVLAGMAIGSVVGPIGTLVGAAIGAFAGAAAGEKIDEIVNPNHYDHTHTHDVVPHDSINALPTMHAHDSAVPHIQTKASSSDLDSQDNTELRKVSKDIL